MNYKGTKITSTEVKWIIQALIHDMSSVKYDMARSEDGSPACALGEIFLDGRSALKTKLMDALENGEKTIHIVK